MDTFQKVLESSGRMEYVYSKWGKIIYSSLNSLGTSETLKNKSEVCTGKLTLKVG